MARRSKRRGFATTRILTDREIAAIIDWLRPKQNQPARSRRINLAIFRLATGCGLRGQEICDLRVGDVILEGDRPCVEVIDGKGGKDRAVPLWWDRGTLDDLRIHKFMRKCRGATDDDPFVVGLDGRKLGVRALRERWYTVNRRVLGDERGRQVGGLHAGRRSFATYALHRGRTLPEVMHAMGHADLGTTSRYISAIAQDGIPDLFSPSPNPSILQFPAKLA